MQIRMQSEANERRLDLLAAFSVLAVGLVACFVVGLFLGALGYILLADDDGSAVGALRRVRVVRVHR